MNNLDDITQHCCACVGCAPPHFPGQGGCCVCGGSAADAPAPGGTVGLDQGDGSTRRIPDAPPAGDPLAHDALARLLVAAATYRFAISDEEASAARDRIRAHIAALTAQNAALVAERDALRGEAKEAKRYARLLKAGYAIQRENFISRAKRCSVLDARDEILKAEAESATRARIEALEWASDLFARAGYVETQIEAEISRLRAEQEHQV